MQAAGTQVEKHGRPICRPTCMWVGIGSKQWHALARGSKHKHRGLAVCQNQGSLGRSRHCTRPTTWPWRASPAPLQSSGAPWAARVVILSNCIWHFTTATYQLEWHTYTQRALEGECCASNSAAAAPFEAAWAAFAHARACKCVQAGACRTWPSTSKEMLVPPGQHLPAWRHKHAPPPRPPLQTRALLQRPAGACAQLQPLTPPR